MIRRILLVWGVAGRTFGVWFRPALFVIGFVSLRTVVGIGMALDHVFFPRIRRVSVDDPILIVGNMRTGTTFLQRFLHDHGVGTGCQVWRLLYPSVVIQSLMKPFLPRLEQLSPVRHYSSAAHKTGLTMVDTDDSTMLARFVDGLFLAGFVLAWGEKDHEREFDPEVRDTTARDVRWLRKVWRRNLVATGGERVLSKLFSATPRVPSILRELPGAKVIYMVRDPVEIFPSGMAMVTGMLDKAMGFWSRPAALRERFLTRLYRGLVLLLARFHEHYTTGRIPADRVLIVRYDRLMSEFETVMDEILAFTGMPKTELLTRGIAEHAAKQRTYKSEHRYSLEQFGLSAEQIRRDCAFVYDTYGVPR